MPNLLVMAINAAKAKTQLESALSRMQSDKAVINALNKEVLSSCSLLMKKACITRAKIKVTKI